MIRYKVYWGGMHTFTQNYVPLPDDIRLAYLDGGQGALLLLMHGFTGTARGHFGTLWSRLSATYRCIAPDLRGYGASRPPPRDFPPDFYRRDAEDMAALIEALAVGPVVVLGFSDGAESALLLAARRPDLVRGVVAWGVSGVISPEMLASVEEWLPVEAWGQERAAWRAKIIARHGVAQFKPLIEGWVTAARAIVAAGGNICYEEAAAIRCPVLLINGQQEIGNTPRDVRRLARRIPTCRLEFIPAAGHAVHEVQPARFLAMVESFLTDEINAVARSG